MDLALNNLQMLICHKTNQPTNIKRWTDVKFSWNLAAENSKTSIYNTPTVLLQNFVTEI